MKKITTKLFMSLAFLIFLYAGILAQANEKATAQKNLEIASSDYADLAAKALGYLTKMDIDKWVSMMSNDVEFYFPDGDESTRTRLTGKAAVQGWWSNWAKTSGVKSMTLEKAVYIPLNSLTKNPSTGLDGVSVISYFTNEMNINGTPLRLRMNFSAHFNKDKLIDRYYTYYDRTKIVAAMHKNILETTNK